MKRGIIGLVLVLTVCLVILLISDNLNKEETPVKKPKKEKEKPVIQNAFVYEDLEERIKSIIGSKVHVNHKANGKGKIEIEYYSDNDLERIFELLMSIQEGE